MIPLAIACRLQSPTEKNAVSRTPFPELAGEQYDACEAAGSTLLGSTGHSGDLVVVEITLLMARKQTYLRAKQFQPHPQDAWAVEQLSDARVCSFGLTPRGRVYGVGGGFADSHVDALLQLPELIEVYVSDLGNSPVFTDNGLEQLLTHPSLKIFGCNSISTITDRSAAALRLSSQMRWFCLNGCAITDIGVQHMSECRQLLGLYLDDTKITEESVPYFCRLTELRYLRLTNTLVTESFRDRLSAHLPRCRSLRLGRRQNAE